MNFEPTRNYGNGEWETPTKACIKELLKKVPCQLEPHHDVLTFRTAQFMLEHTVSPTPRMVAVYPRLKHSYTCVTPIRL